MPKKSRNRDPRRRKYYNDVNHICRSCGSHLRHESDPHIKPICRNRMCERFGVAQDGLLIKENDHAKTTTA